jgi:type IV secretion system protein VirB3
MADDKEILEIDILFAGATRPAMMLGVSYEFFIINGMFAAIFFLAVGNPFYMAIVFPGHILGYLMCMEEPRRFGILFKWLEVAGKCRNRMFWKSSTYTP